MEYIFGNEYHNCRFIETLKTVSDAHTDFNGSITVTRNYADNDITDSFKVVEKIRSDDDIEGNCYDWYEIKDHYRFFDKFTPGIKPIETNITDNEINVLELEQQLTDAEIAIIELQELI